MSLEYLTWPYMERFFGDGAQAYRDAHLSESIMFLPYGVAVDHFQHLVYETPQATPEERHLMWEMVRGAVSPVAHLRRSRTPAHGAFWQGQLHIYRLPFYYIDYTLALCCALQIVGVVLRRSEGYARTLRTAVRAWRRSRVPQSRHQRRHHLTIRPRRPLPRRRPRKRRPRPLARAGHRLIASSPHLVIPSGVEGSPQSSRSWRCFDFAQHDRWLGKALVGAGGCDVVELGYLVTE